MGRERDISALVELVGSERLVTLTGPPGIGKTRLALKVAGELAGSRRSADGVALAELAAIADPNLVPGAVASALDVAEVAGASITDVLVGHLRERRLLLVLDNCEHVIDACAQLVGALLEGCPGLVVLATSRESLGSAGECAWPVRQLTVPALGETDPGALMGYESVALFVARARSVKPGFVLDEDEDVPAAVAELSRRLEGIPLAIELAAARVGVLTPAEISARLDDRFAVLRRARGNGPPRHQTLQAALDWSHDLLGDGERVLLRRLSVFVDGFCLAAAEDVCADADGPVARGGVLDLLERLVSKSLMVSNTANSRGRYRLLETVRAYAADRLEESGEAGDLHEAHARFYLALAEEAEPQLTGPGQQKWLDRLEGERQNLRFALLWCAGHGDGERALRLAGALVLYWRVRCHFAEGRDLLETAVDAGEGAAPQQRAKGLWGVGFMRVMTGDARVALAALDESFEIFRELEDRSGQARAVLMIASIAAPPPDALALYARSAELARDAGDRWCLAHALCLSGQLHCTLNDLPEARSLLEEGLAVGRAARDHQSLKFGLLGLGLVALNQGDYPAAEALLEEAAAVARGLGAAYDTASGVHHLGWLALGRGFHSRARELFEEAEVLRPKVGPSNTELAPLLAFGRLAHIEGDRRRARALFDEVEAIGDAQQGTSVVGLLYTGDLLADDLADEARARYEDLLARVRRPGWEDPALAALALTGLGRLARAAGDAPRAVALHGEALDLQRGIGVAPDIVASIEAIGGLACLAGRPRDAARLLGAADAQRERHGYARLPWERERYEADLAAARGALGRAACETALAEGARLSLDEAAVRARKGRRRKGRPASGWASLTDTERSVAELVADNLTNPQIAERLLVSTATVKSHLLHISSKLAVRGRRELAQEVWRVRHLADKPGDPSGAPAANGDETPAS